MKRLCLYLTLNFLKDIDFPIFIIFIEKRFNNVIDNLTSSIIVFVLIKMCVHNVYFVIFRMTFK